MHQYRMIESWADRKRCLLRCSNDRYHVARALHQLPLANMLLRGEKPHLGFGILLCVATGSIYRVIFESINEPLTAYSPDRAPSVRAGATALGSASRLG
jgi:hypothetical protein